MTAGAGTAGWVAVATLSGGAGGRGMTVTEDGAVFAAQLGPRAESSSSRRTSDDRGRDGGRAGWAALATLSGGAGGHGMTVTEDGAVFAAQLVGRVQKFVVAADE